ncbi:uncharacterized protein LOC127810903 isoform X2 [Diospyros lotus]|uniref:uncharacterized protein LOC127810903 isoform X2 n=1 Tax=Diospyros lotus TaxID=55363 RepID=UPI002257B318|nr:uncharacterized protein LOC127810903 isoform X2 [Diospyros lotus]
MLQVKDLLLRTQMALMSLRRIANFTPAVNFHSLSRMLCFSSSSRTFFDNENGGGATQSPLINNEGIGIASSGAHLSTLFSRGTAHLQGCRIELVDDEAWQLSSGLAEAWRGRNRAPEGTGLVTEAVDEEMVTSSLPSEDDPNFDEIDDMRIRGSLFYKIDRDSKEFEEYSFDFHGKKQTKNKQNRKERENSKGKLASEAEKSSKNKEEQKETRKRENASYDSVTEGKGLPKLLKNDVLNSSLHEMDSSCGGKRERALTFNQLTAPYHEPFCLDIYLTKGSVRACIIHRATSKVVAVAHSISKDMKFDLSSVRNATACAAVGHVLAQRALADDIHNVVYTPRKGEKLEGKLQIVLQSIIDNGVNVKVKIKQRKVKKGTRSPLP